MGSTASEARRRQGGGGSRESAKCLKSEEEDFAFFLALRGLRPHHSCPAHTHQNYWMWRGSAAAAQRHRACV